MRFDALLISTSDGALAEIARPLGPIEHGSYDPVTGDWVPVSVPTRVAAPGFGVDSGGNPYFDTSGPATGEAADLWVDAVNGLIWLEDGQ